MTSDDEFYICIKPFEPEFSHDFLKLEKGDIIKLDAKIDKAQGRGTNLRTSECGYFLFSCVAQKRLPSRGSSPSLIVESGFVSAYSQDDNVRDDLSFRKTKKSSSAHTSRQSNLECTQPSPNSTFPLLPHRVTSYSVKVPLLCAFCQDFVLYLTVSAKRCSACSQLFHQPCYDSVKSRKIKCRRSSVSVDSLSSNLSSEGVACSLDSSDRVLSAISNNPVCLSEWDNSCILQWLITVNLSRFIDVFRFAQYTGDDIYAIARSVYSSECSQKENFIPDLIKDPMHRWMIALAALQLFSMEPSPYIELSECLSQSDTSSRSSVSSIGSTNYQPHHFVISTVLTKTSCFYCNTFLIGTEHQGLRCCNCKIFCHRICSLQENLPPCSNYQPYHDCRSSCYTKSFFAVPLDCQPGTKSETNVPIFLQACVHAFENLIKGRSSKEIIDFYKAPSFCSEIAMLRENADSILMERNYFESEETREELYLRLLDHLGRIGACRIMRILKYFLRDLPDSVWPTSLFIKTMNIIRETADNNNQRIYRVKRLLDELPQNHSSTLIFMLSHFQRMEELDAKSETSNKHSINWSPVFWNILLRVPRLEQPMYFDKLYRDYQFAFLDTLVNIFFPSQPDYSTYKFSSLPLTDCDWYWGDITKEEVTIVMNEQPDGSFLVRDATDKIGYTLAIKLCGENKLLRIYCHEQQFYDIYSPSNKQFKSVQELIDHYLTYPFPEISSKLSNPVSRTAFYGSYGNLRSYSNDQLVSELLKTEEMLSQLSNLLEDYLAQYQKLHVDIEDKSRQIKVGEKMILWFTDQFKLLIENNQHANSEQEREGIRNHGLLVKRRIDETRQKIMSIEEEIKNLGTETRDLLENINTKRPESKKLTKLQQQITFLLRERGAPSFLFNSVDNMDHILFKKILLSLDTNAPINIKSNWFSDCSREASTRRLIDLPNGTFLIRPSSQSKNYSLDVKVGDAVKHIRIFVSADNKCGFVENHCPFSSLQSLVFYYHFTSLSQHNEEMTVTLKYPVNADREIIDQYFDELVRL